MVLVDFWATLVRTRAWNCSLTRPRFQQRLGRKGLTVVTISLDDPDSEAAVRRFLDQQGAAMDNFLSVYGVGPEAFTAFGIADGGLPHVRLYDRQGKLRRTFASGGKAIDPAEVERAVEELLK